MDCFPDILGNNWNFATKLDDVVDKYHIYLWANKTQLNIICESFIFYKPWKLVNRKSKLQAMVITWADQSNRRAMSKTDYYSLLMTSEQASVTSVLSKYNICTSFRSTGKIQNEKYIYNALRIIQSHIFHTYTCNITLKIKFQHFS